MNQFDELMGYSNDQELAGFFKKIGKSIKKVGSKLNSARKKVTPKPLRKIGNKVGKALKPIVTNPLFKGVATAAASLVGAGPLVYSGISALSIAGKASKVYDAAKGYSKAKRAIGVQKEAEKLADASAGVAPRADVDAFYKAKMADLVKARNSALDAANKNKNNPQLKAQLMAAKSAYQNKINSLNSARANYLRAYSVWNRRKSDVTANRTLGDTITKLATAGDSITVPTVQPVAVTPAQTVVKNNVEYLSATPPGATVQNIQSAVDSIGSVAASPEFKNTVNSLKAQGATDAQIEQLWLQSQTYRNAAIPAVAKAVTPEYQAVYRAQGLPDWRERGEVMGAEEAVKAVDTVQAEAGGIDLAKLALPAALVASALIFGA